MTDSYHATCAELHLLNGEEPHDLSLATQVAFTIKAYYRSLDQAPGTPGVQVMFAQAQIHCYEVLGALKAAAAYAGTPTESAGPARVDRQWLASMGTDPCPLPTWPQPGNGRPDWTY